MDQQKEKTCLIFEKTATLLPVMALGGVFLVVGVLPPSHFPRFSVA
jgi:hypothetical protein